MVSMWFKNDTNLVTMIELLKVVKSGTEESIIQDSWAKRNSKARSESSKEALDKGACFVLQGTHGSER